MRWAILTVELLLVWAALALATHGILVALASMYVQAAGLWLVGSGCCCAALALDLTLRGDP
jgi:hypothetical protein